jgi:hypothetical protein
MRALTTATLSALTTAGMTALQHETFQALTGITPLILDLDGNGINTTSVRQRAMFDHTGSGTPIKTGWISGRDGLLVRDLNGDGVINDGRELFGQGTLLANGQRANNGYEALSALDTNHDGIISSSDADFKSLMVWSETAVTGSMSGSGKLQSMADLEITSISLNSSQSGELNNGNLIGLMGSFTTSDGKTHTMGDVWFQTDISGNKVFDLAAALSGHQAELGGGKVHLAATDQATLNVGINDVLSFGQSDVMGGHELVIEGSQSTAVHLTDGGQWSSQGQVDMGGEHYLVYVDPLHHARLLVNDKISVIF